MATQLSKGLESTQQGGGEGLPGSTTSRTAGHRFLLLLYHRGGAEAYPLVEGSELVVGRELVGDAIPDPSLSRRHARFALREGRVLVEDLGSKNGTLVDGEPIGAREISPGDEVVLGGVVASVHTLSGHDAQLRGLLGHAAFRELLAGEARRARFFQRGFSLMMVAPVQRGVARIPAWMSAVLGALRPVDVAGLYSTEILEILLPEASAETAGAMGEALVSRSDVALRVGTVTFPDHGASEEELIALAGRALRRATEQRRVVPGGESRGTLDAPSATPAGDPSDPIANAPAFADVLSKSRRLARGVIPVLILGETGSGKEVVARFIHERSPRRDKPLVSVNCAAIPTHLVESTLFGHERGAFTGATQQHRGVFEVADGGTVLLDEVGELPPAAQAALLRVLETKRFCRVGSTREIQIDVRLVAATHRDLDQMCDVGEFRRDLLYRLNTMTLKVPPLRARREDIPELARRFLLEANAANGTDVGEIDDEAMSLLQSHDWPGNVRELRNALERAVVIARGRRVTVEDLPDEIQGSPEPRSDSAPPAAADDDSDFRSQLDRAEVTILARALEQCGNNQTLAARRLRMPLRTLVYKLRAHGIRRRPS